MKAPGKPANQEWQLRELLERVFYAESAEDWKELRISAGTLLGDLLREDREWRSLAGVLERLLQLAGTEEQRDAVLLTLAELYETKLAAPFMAFGLVARALQQRPGDEKIRTYLEGLARRYRMNEELVGLYLDTAESFPEEFAAAELKARAAYILECHRKSKESSMEPRKREKAPVPPVPTLEDADTELEENLPVPVSEVSTVRAVRPARGPIFQARQNALLQELYATADELEREGAIEETLAVLRRITEIKPDAGCAWLWLETLLDRAERWSELADVLEDRIESGRETVGACTTLRLRLAEVLLLKLSSMKGFLPLREVLQDKRLAGRGIVILESLRDKGKAWGEHAEPWLVSAYRKTQQWEKLCALLRQELDRECSLRQRSRLFQEIIDLHEKHLGQKMQAFLVACQAFREMPKQLSFRAALERLALETESRDELAAILDEVAA